MKRAFRAMGTQIEVVADPTTDPTSFVAAVAAVEAIFEREESRFSRFRSDSELSRVNRSAGHWTDVSSPFAAVVAIALDGAERTGGLFDPTVLPALEAAGYDRDFATIEPRDRDVPITAVPCGGWMDIELHDGRIRLPEEIGLDLGGLAKGWTADLAAAALVAAGSRWAIVDAGATSGWLAMRLRRRSGSKTRRIGARSSASFVSRTARSPRRP